MKTVNDKVLHNCRKNVVFWNVITIFHFLYTKFLKSTLLPFCSNSISVPKIKVCIKYYLTS